MDTNHYDVIIIGTGAGGGTLAHHLLLPERKFWSWSGADFCPKRKIIGTPKRYLPMENIRPPKHGLTKTEKYFIRAFIILSAGIQNSMARHCCVFAKRILGKSSITGVFPRHGRIQYEDMEAYYTKAEELYHVHGQAGIDPTEPPRQSFSLCAAAA